MKTAQVRVAAIAVVVGLAAFGVAAGSAQELHHRLDVSEPTHARDIALTLDACGGAYDRELVATLVRLQVPATLFVTQRWVDRNPAALQELMARPDLFEIENHGRAHVPARVGGDVYKMHGPADLAGVQREVEDGAQAVLKATKRAPSWYRGAGAAYDTASQQLIERLGFRIAGFSLNADDGAQLPAAGVARRLQKATAGDIVLAHMNHPESGTAEGLAAVLPELLARGFKFVKLSQAAHVRAVK